MTDLTASGRILLRWTTFLAGDRLNESFWESCSTRFFV